MTIILSGKNHGHRYIKKNHHYIITEILLKVMLIIDKPE